VEKRIPRLYPSGASVCDLRTSAVWIQDAVTYSFLQTMNPGPTHFAALRLSETDLRKSIQSVLQERCAMDRAVANPDPVDRGMMVELESSGIKVNLVSPGFTKTNLNGYAGTQSVEEGSREVVRVALLGPDGPTGTFTRWENATIPW
jgi:hypothetical protein